ncbi:MAG: hypothetical protein JKY94_06345 [Rhodobacteraceae bacterium]|nr:hypothetical protein [Paracoccaceae bacterium]
MISHDGEVRETTADDLKFAGRGRPFLLDSDKKRRVNLMLDPEVVERLKLKGNMSAAANKILRETLGL